MSESTDRRNHRRLARDEKVIIQVVSSASDPSLTGLTVKCSTVDVSAQGLRVKLDKHVPEGYLLELFLQISGQSRRYFLGGEVKWSHEVEGEEDCFLTGIQLIENAGDDLADWIEQFDDDGGIQDADDRQAVS